MTRPSAATTLPAFMRAIAAEFGDSDAVVSLTERMSYRELDERSAVMARGLLALGVPKYARMGMLFPNSPEWVVALMAITRIGAIAVPLSTFGTGKELERTIRHNDCCAVVVGGSRTRWRDELLAGLGEPVRSAGPLIVEGLPFLRLVVDLTGLPSAPEWCCSRSALNRAASHMPDRVLEAAEREVHQSDPAVIISTSGSTSAPKGVVHSHGGAMAQTSRLADYLGFDACHRTYTTMPFFWVGGLSLSLLPTLATGGTQATTERVDPSEIFELIERERLDRVFVYPASQLATVLAHPDGHTRDLSSVRRGSPSAALAAETLSTFASGSDGLGMGLGMSETFGPYWYGAPDDFDAVTPPLSKLIDGWELKVVDKDGRSVADGERGEILVRGPSLAIGLQKIDRSERFDSGGFYRTGDIGLVDGSLVRYRGRDSDMIKIKGANVAPAEVAEALSGVPGVQTVHVVGVPTDEGLVLGAAVVAVQGAFLDVSTLRAAAVEQLSSFKVPSIIRIVQDDEVPLSAVGKLRRVELAALLRNTPVTSSKETT